MAVLASELRSTISGRFLVPNAGTLADDTDLFLHLDSLDIIRLVSHLEKTYRVEVADDEMIADNLGSVARIAAFLERKRAVVTAGPRP